MSRTQTRISDHRRAQLGQTTGQTVGREGRPSVLDDRFGPRVDIHLLGASKNSDANSSDTEPSSSSSRSVDLRRSNGPNSELVFAPAELLQCEYHLLDFDGYELQPTISHSNSTLRRRRRGLNVGKRSDRLTDKRSAFVRHRNSSPAKNPGAPTIEAIENSVVWQTSGKGDTDFGVHFFERREAKSHQPLELYQPYVFRTVCPNSPLTFHGKLLSITWLVRVRVFLSTGDGLTFERKFDLKGV